MVWVDVHKAYDSVDHRWLNEMNDIAFPSGSGMWLQGSLGSGTLKYQ